MITTTEEKAYISWDEGDIVDCEVTERLAELWGSAGEEDDPWDDRYSLVSEWLEEFLEAAALTRQANAFVTPEEMRALFKQCGFSEDKLEEKLRHEYYEDSDFWQFTWEWFEEQLGEMLHAIAKRVPNAKLLVSASRFDWTGRSGKCSLPLDPDKPKDMLRKTINDFSKATMEVYWNETENEFRIWSACHDVPTGGTYYFKAVPMEDGEEE